MRGRGDNENGKWDVQLNVRYKQKDTHQTGGRLREKRLKLGISR